MNILKSSREKYPWIAGGSYAFLLWSLILRKQERPLDPNRRIREKTKIIWTDPSCVGTTAHRARFKQGIHTRSLESHHLNMNKAVTVTRFHGRLRRRQRTLSNKACGNPLLSVLCYHERDAIEFSERMC